MIAARFSLFKAIKLAERATGLVIPYLIFCQNLRQLLTVLAFLTWIEHLLILTYNSHEKNGLMTHLKILAQTLPTLSHHYFDIMLIFRMSAS